MKSVVQCSFMYICTSISLIKLYIYYTIVSAMIVLKYTWVEQGSVCCYSVKKQGLFHHQAKNSI